VFNSTFDCDEKGYMIQGRSGSWQHALQSMGNFRTRGFGAKGVVMLSKAIHPAMITDPDDSFVCDLVVSGCVCRVVNHHRRLAALDYMDRDIERATQSQDLWFASPRSSVAYGSAVALKPLRRHHASVESTNAVLPGIGGQERKEVIGMSVNISRCGYASVDI